MSSFYVGMDEGGRVGGRSSGGHALDIAPAWVGDSRAAASRSASRSRASRHSAAPVGCRRQDAGGGNMARTMHVHTMVAHIGVLTKGGQEMPANDHA
jgi:hypothetical protein